MAIAFAEVGERQAVDRLRRYARCDVASTRSGPGWFAVASHAFSNDMNGVVSEPGAPITSEVVDELIGWFARQRLPASWIVTGEDGALAALLVERGATKESTGWWAGRPIEADLLDLPCPSGLDVARVGDERDLDGWLDMAAACGWFDDDRDRQVRRRLYLAIGLDDGELTHWLARRRGRPVGMASSFSNGPVLELCDLAVPEPERRHGIGRALAGARIRAAHERGATTVVASLSPDGWALYRTLGFESVPVTPGRWFYLPMT